MTNSCWMHNHKGMLFPTSAFAFFFLAVFLAYWYVFRQSRQRRVFLILVSYFYYALWDWRACFLLLAVTAANYGFALWLGSVKDHLKRKLVLVLAVFVNLAVLGFFKYYNFFAGTLNSALHRAAAQGGTQPDFLFPVLAVLMPIGISYYTFKALSYIFDVYLCKLPPVRSFGDVMLYVSFFPQIASGPIVHAVDFFPQIAEAASSGYDVTAAPIEFDRATVLLVSGLFKKLVLANFLSTLLVDPVFADLDAYGTVDALLAAFGYSIVIYTDFSGYSDLASGFALLLGYRTPANFIRPYAASSITDFWKRWHITFSSWLREYLYFSLGGSRFGLARTLFALVFTMLLAGLWHGPSWSFLLWGALQGVALAIERATGFGQGLSGSRLQRIGRITLTFVFTTLLWIVFRSATLHEVGQWYRALIRYQTGPLYFQPLILLLLAIGVSAHFIPEKSRELFFRWWIAVPLPLKALILASFLSFLSIVSMSGVAPFIYFQF